MPNALHIETSRTRIGVQSSIGTAASNMIDIEVLGSAPDVVKSTQRTAPNNAQVRRRREYKAPVKLTKVGSEVAMSCFVKGLASPLLAAASPVAFDNASALSHQLLLRAMLGAELAPAAGSTVAGSSGTPVDTITVATGHGSRFTIGAVIFIVGFGPRRVTAISSDDLTVSPPLDSSPSVGTVVRNCYCYYPGETDSTTFTVEHTFVESGTAESQMRAIGVHGQGEMKLENDAPAELSFKGQALDVTGPSDLSISDDPVADDMGDPLVWSPTTWLLSSLSSAPSVTSHVASTKVSIPRKWQRVGGSVVNGVGSVHEVAGRGEPIDIEVDGLFDSDWHTWFTNDTALTLVTWTQVGTGSSARIFGIWAGTTKVVESPGRSAKEALLFSQAKLRAFQDTTVSGAAPALSVAGIRTANCIVFLG